MMEMAESHQMRRFTVPAHNELKPDESLPSQQIDEELSNISIDTLQGGIDFYKKMITSF